MAIKFTAKDRPAAAPAAGQKSVPTAAPIDKEAAVAGDQAAQGTDLFPAEPKASSRKRRRK